MSDAMIGTVTAHFYSAHHPAPTNGAYVGAFKKANPGMRPNFFSVSGYDGMHLIYDALKKINGDNNGDAVVVAMKRIKWEILRGSISYDLETREIVESVNVC